MRHSRALLAFLVSALVGAQVNQVWLNYGGDPTTMVVTWTSAYTNETVGWTTTGTDYAWSGAPELVTYSTAPIEEVQDLYTSGIIHRVVLEGLPLGTRISYRIGNHTDSYNGSFLSHPGVGPTVAIKMMILADMDFECFDGKRCNPKAVVSQLSQPGYLEGVNAGAVFAGDLAYSNGNSSHWDGWQRFIEPVSNQLSIMTNAGNHEFNTEPLAIPFKTRFGGMPYADPTNVDSGALFYSYNVGGVHVVVLCAYSDFSSLSPQTVFLLNDLASVNRTLTPWVVCVFHPPFYNSNKKHYLDPSGVAMRLAYEPILLQFRVNAVFVGHVHAYQRSTMVYNDTVVDPATGQGIYYFMVGISGKELYPDWRPEEFPWMVKRNATFWGTAYFTVPNATHAHFAVHCFQGDGYDCDPNTPWDEFWFTNQLDVNPLPPAPGPSPSATSDPQPEILNDDPLSFPAALGTGTAIGAVGMLGVAMMVVHYLRQPPSSRRGEEAENDRAPLMQPLQRSMSSASIGSSGRKAARL